MSFISRVRSGNLVGVLDFGAESAAVIIADKTSQGVIRILGAGESPASGVSHGMITHMGDAAESIYAAACKAEAAAGAKPQSLDYNINDMDVVWRSPLGSKILDGEGEIQPSDIKAAALAAQRLVGDYEKTLLYAKETDFVVDDRDPVVNPVGIFGHKISLALQSVLVSTAYYDSWQKLLRRAGFSRSKPYLSGLSVVEGVFTAEEKKGSRILWDLGRDVLTGIVYKAENVRGYRVIASDDSSWDQSSAVVLAVTQGWIQQHDSVEEVVLTGDLSADEKVRTLLKEGLSLPVRSAIPQGIDKITNPSHAALGGLLRLALDSQKKSLIAHSEKGVFASAKEKATSFLNEYF